MLSCNARKALRIEQFRSVDWQGSTYSNRAVFLPWGARSFSIAPMTRIDEVFDLMCRVGQVWRAASWASLHAGGESRGVGVDVGAVQFAPQRSN